MKQDPLNSPAFVQNPSLHAFLPILYLVWADLLLTPTEIQQIKKIISEMGQFSEEEKSTLEKFLDPNSPPDPVQLKNWLKEIRKVSDQISEDEKQSIVDIGIRLASINSSQGTMDPSVDSINSLVRIEEALGIISREASFQFFLNTRRNLQLDDIEEKHTFNPKDMTRLLDGSSHEIIQKVKTILSDPIFNYTDPDQHFLYREKVLEWCKELSKQGYGAIAYPEAYGGKDDLRSYFALFESLSYHDLSMVVKFGVQFGLFGMSILYLGTEKHHKKYLEAIGKLELPGCFAMTETGHGSNVRGIETQAVYDHDLKVFTINTPDESARKDYIGNAALHGRMATVFAKLIIGENDYGVSAFLVPIRNDSGELMEGIDIEDCGKKMGLNGVDNGRISFSNVQIPLDNLLDRYGQISEQGEYTSPILSDNRRFFTMLGTLVGGRIGIPRAGLSAAKSGITIATRYALQRKQFGPEGSPEVPILNYRSHQKRLMPLLAETYAIHFSLDFITERFINRKEDEMQIIESMAAGLKAYATWFTTAALQECRECCGGAGYLSKNRLDRLKNDTEIFTTFEGDNNVLMLLVAKNRLVEFKQDFGNLDFFGILNFVGKQAKTGLQELNPVIIRNTDRNHLLDPEFHLNAFIYREKSILQSAAQRIKKYIDSGLDSFDAMNSCQNHLKEVGKSYIERIILEQFQIKLEETDNVECKLILQKLYQLFALNTIQKNKGWYLENNYMEGVKTKAIRKEVNRLCFEVREESLDLIKAFNIPASCLAAPIAFNS